MLRRTRLAVDPLGRPNPGDGQRDPQAVKAGQAEPSARRREGRRPVRLFAALGLVALLLAIFAVSQAPPLQAQSTPDTLVTNRNEGYGPVESGLMAQSFTTGTTSGRIVLTSVRLDLSSVVGIGKVVIRENSDDDTPGDLLAELVTLTGSDLLGGGSFVSFPTQDTVELESNTTYWISVNEGLSTEQQLDLFTVFSGLEVGVTDEWTIANSLLLRTSADDEWEMENTPLRIGVQGYIAPRTYVDNMSLGSVHEFAVSPSPIIAQSFTTGSATYGYDIPHVTVRTGATSSPIPITDARLREHNTDTGQPGALIAQLSTSQTFGQYRYIDFTPNGSLELKPNTRYWIVVNEAAESQSNRSAWRANGSDDQNAESGWSLGDVALVKTSAQDNWQQQHQGLALSVAVHGFERDPVNLDDLDRLTVTELTGSKRVIHGIYGGNNVDVLRGSYRRTVANRVLFVTIRAEPRGLTAPVVFLDEDDNILDDADPDSQFFQSPLLPSGVWTVIKIKVTAETAETTTEYVLRFRRLPGSGHVVVSDAPVVVQEGTDGGYRLSLNKRPTADVTINISAAAPGDEALEISPQSVTFRSSDWDARRRILVRAVADADRVNEAYTLTHATTSDDNDFAGLVSDLQVNVDDRSQVDYFLHRIKPSLGAQPLPYETMEVYVSGPYYEVFTIVKRGHEWTPTGIWGDTELGLVWVVDSERFGIHALELSELKAGRIVRREAADTSEFDHRFNYHCHFKRSRVPGIGNSDLSVIWGDDSTIWVANQRVNGLQAYRRNGNLTAGCKVDEVTALSASSVTPEPVDLKTPYTRSQNHDYYLTSWRNPDRYGITGIWSNGTTFWVARQPGGVYTYNPGTGTFRKSPQLTNDFTVSGLWSDGTTIWLATANHGLRAYDLDTGERRPSLDIRLRSAGSMPPGDIWSDDEVIWVTWPLGSIDAYQLPERSYRSAMGSQIGLMSVGGGELTARFSDAPASHDGATEFGVQIEFSRADLRVTAQALRDALTLLGAELVDVAQVDDRLDLWELRLQPTGSGSVSILLLPSGKCPKKGGALCTTDDLPLTSSLGLQLPGPKGGKGNTDLLKSLESESPLDSAPEAPGRPRSQAVFIGGVDLEWDAVRAADSYEVQLSRQGVWADLPSGGVEIAYYGAGAIISGLDRYSTQWFRLRAANSHGVSDWSPVRQMNATNEYGQGRKPRPANQAATGAPVIRGEPAAGATLWADTSAIEDGNGLDRVQFQYQWIADKGEDAEAIAGATHPTYIWTEADAERSVSVRVSFVDRGGYAELLTSEAVTEPPPPNNPASGDVTITGTAQVGETLTAVTKEITDADGLTNVTYKYQWLAGGLGGDDEIADATESTYVVGESDVGRNLRVRVSFSDDASNPEVMTSAQTETVTYAVSEQIVSTPAEGSLTVTGTQRVGETLTADPSGITDADGLEEVSFSYQWKRYHLQDDIETVITGATGVSYELSDDDFGHVVGVSVSFSDDAGHPEEMHSGWLAISARLDTAPEGDATITGTPRVGETLTADTSQVTDADGLTSATYDYQWLSDDDGTVTEIAGATGSTYTLQASDEDNLISVQVTITDDRGFESTLSSTWLTVSARPDSPAAGEVTITGTPQVGETLTADTSGITDADGLTNAAYAYQWLSDDSGTVTEISGANSSTYTLKASDEDNLIQVQVTITDDRGFNSTLSSTWLTVLARLDSPPAGVPTIRGTAQVGETLTADVSKITDADGLTTVSYEYQWLAEFSGLATEISGATASSYTLQAAEEGAAIKVRVRFSDDRGHSSTLTSAATDTVVAAIEPPAQPGNLTASVNADGTVSLSWDAPSDDTVSGYRILRRRPDQGDTEFLVLVGDTGSTATEFTDRMVEPGVRYVYVVAALNPAGAGAPSGAVEATPPRVEEPVGNREATGAPVIRGSALVGETLTVDLSGITDADGLTGADFRYQWILTDGGSLLELQGATESTYTIVALDRYVRMLVRVSFIDDRGHKETRTSEATAVIR